MKWFHHIVVSVIAVAISRGHHIEFEKSSEESYLENLKLNKENTLDRGVRKVQSYSEWAPWSACQGGSRTRRRHCLRHHVCGDSLRIEVARLPDPGYNYKVIFALNILCSTLVSFIFIYFKSCGSFRHKHGQNYSGVMNIYNRHLLLRNLGMRQTNLEDVQKIFRGFSPWSSWTTCSRKCTTVRRRYCQHPTVCGKKVIRQSAYCYLEGSYCHLWIRGRMQRRKDPEYTIKEPENFSQPALAIHPEDSRTFTTRMPPCGRLGRYHGTAKDRLRARMRDMVRIIGGRPAPPGKWIWQVAVLNRYKEAFCGGTLISVRWVVTAAHCVRRRLYVRLGEHDLFVRNHGELEMRVTQAVIHPSYDPDTVVNDVALLRLPEPARPELGHGIACLPRPNQPLLPHTSCSILGWGKKRSTDEHGTRILQEAQVSTIQQGVCRRSYWQYAITDNMVCAGRGHRDSCAGDSGGPLLCRDRNKRYVLQGITSFGDGCGKRGKYGIYTKTAGYVTWMYDVMSDKYFDD